jgi:glycosyltransferase involved in cell wall biosynthesis
MSTEGLTAATESEGGPTATRVVVDGRELTGMGRFSGLGTFTRNLLRSLADDPNLDLRVLSSDPASAPAGVEPVRVWRRFHERRRSVYEHEALISFDMARCRGDVVYSPVLCGVPFTRRPYVQTLHDVIPLVLDDPDLVYLRRWWSRWGRAYRKADAVVADSRYTADEGIRVLGLDPGRVHVGYVGVGSQYTPRPTDEPDDPPYLLVVSEFSARKGFADAFGVIGALSEAGYPHHLKVAGRVQPQFRDELDRLVRSAPAPERIEVLGFVDDLAELYRGATAFLCCSRYEGFGIPIVEAMASGVPVLTYDNSSLTELAEGAGVLVADGDVSAMVGEVRRVVDSASAREELRSAGFARASAFTWASCAATYAEVFASVADRGRR